MPDTYVELNEIPVMRVRADMKGKGPPAAFDLLESKLPTLKGRKFYGTFRETPDGEEYFACVAQIETDDPRAMQLETGVIPGGLYARRKIQDWEKIVRAGQLPRLFQEMIQANVFDHTRPSVEFYRSQTELQLLVPVKSSKPSRHDFIRGAVSSPSCRPRRRVTLRIGEDNNSRANLISHYFNSKKTK
jgi:hypothetical protein